MGKREMTSGPGGGFAVQWRWHHFCILAERATAGYGGTVFSSITSGECNGLLAAIEASRRVQRDSGQVDTML